VASALAEQFDEQIGRAVDDRRLPDESGRAAHETGDPHHPGNAVDRSQCRRRGGEQVERHRAGEVVCGGEIDTTAHHTGDHAIAVPRHVTRQKEKIAGTSRGNVARQRRAGHGKRQPKRRQPVAEQRHRSLR
jgi:hypothetical protein